MISKEKEMNVTFEEKKIYVLDKGLERKEKNLFNKGKGDECCDRRGKEKL